MKRITFTLFASLAPSVLNAQSFSEAFADSDMLKIGIAVICMGLAMLFILEMFRRFFDFQIKSKALEMRVPEELASVILNDKPGKDRKSGIKWSFIFAGLGFGLTLVHYTRPWGTHSFAIMAFSLAAAFFGYYCYIRFSEK
ncbi:hypothetical protein LZD49_19840 [Dyadobacter sp. CY261]|uniref:hypothetical protein n=1 Tax=Dyadobacter sp. CY261 TaxID=2907203 RepID=UPI001F2BEE03|nr:hypothetical protein [Dyadobacter sp. CY261]MCF0072743.1 hypothetical protein [Dyadobacter sp. CY261]